MFSQILMDISLNRCPQLLPDTTQEFRTYINGILEQAPPHKEVRSSFMQMWNGLVKCFRLSTESLSRLVTKTSNCYCYKLDHKMFWIPFIEQIKEKICAISKSDLLPTFCQKRDV